MFGLLGNNYSELPAEETRRNNIGEFIVKNIAFIGNANRDENEDKNGGLAVTDGTDIYFNNDNTFVKIDNTVSQEVLGKYIFDFLNSDYMNIYLSGKDGAKIGVTLKLFDK